MERKFKCLSIFEFQKRFQSDEDCYAYLEKLKWQYGYICPKCGNDKYCSSVHSHSRQCTRCSYHESVTAGTLFHKCKFSLLKAFYIIFYVSTSKKGIASTELSRKLELRQKTCWLFKHKVMKAMESSQLSMLEGNVDLDEIEIYGKPCFMPGYEIGTKQKVVVAIEKKGRGVARFYARVVKNACCKNVGLFLKDFIAPYAKINVDNWSGHRGLKQICPDLTIIAAKDKPKQFALLHRTVKLMLAWMQGVHHSVSLLQPYLDEFSFRFNRHLKREGMFEALINRMVLAKPYPYKDFSR